MSRTALKRSLLTSITVALLALVACGGSTSTAQKPTTTMTTLPMTNVAYGPLPEEKLDLCTPNSSTSPRPGVIMIHGGAWAAGDKQAYAAACAYLAAHGFVAASINYRLAPTNIWPAQVIDAQLATRWLRAHADDYHLDTNRLCAWGDSAGAHLAVFLGVKSDIHPGDEAALYADQSPKASCVVDAFGPIDLTVSASLATTTQRDILLNLFGNQTPEVAPDLYRDASPIIDVSASSAPMLIIQGTQDTLVPPSQSQELQQHLQADNVPTQFISYTGGHGYTGVSQADMDAINNQIFAYLVAQEHP